MTRSARLLVGAIADLYLLWLGTWIVFGSALLGPLRGQSQNDWSEDLARKISEAVAGIVRDYGFTAVK